MLKVSGLVVLDNRSLKPGKRLQDELTGPERGCRTGKRRTRIEQNSLQ